VSDHPCVSRRLRKEKGTFVIIWFVKWKEKNMGPSEKHVRGQEEESETMLYPFVTSTPQVMKPAMRFGTLNAVSHIHDPLGI